MYKIDGDVSGKSALYKHYDWEEPDSAKYEKLYSVIAKRILTNCRVPDIEMINDIENSGMGLLSYRILDRTTEELIDIHTLLLELFTKEEVSSMNEIISLEDLIKCLRMEISDEQNYCEVEKSVIETLILDSILNNPDRHSQNWGIVREKRTGKYTLGLFDHSKTFYGLDGNKEYNTIEGWVNSYIKREVEVHNSRYRKAFSGDELLKYLNKLYPECFNSFIDKINRKKYEIYDIIERSNMPIGSKQTLTRRINEHIKFAGELLYRGERDE